MRVYDRFTFGDLIEISVIDGRQYRSREACYGPPNKGGGHLETNGGCPERLDAGRTMMGFDQEAWLYTALAHSKAKWNLIAQDVLMAQLRREAGRHRRASGPTIGTAIRQTARGCCKRIHDTKVSNPVVASGDIHSFFANDLQLDFDDPVLADRRDGIRRHVDLVLRAAIRPARADAAGQSARPFLRKPAARLCHASISKRAQMQVRMRVVSDAHDPKADISTLKTYAVESGRAGVVEA